MSQWGRPKPPLITPLCLALMDEFARYGFDVWTMDHEGYGRSTRTDSNSDILSGVERGRLPEPSGRP
jgi:alpha-beta hydrolase superfamily lysophospholipase